MDVRYLARFLRSFPQEPRSVVRCEVLPYEIYEGQLRKLVRKARLDKSQARLLSNNYIQGVKLRNDKKWAIESCQKLTSYNHLVMQKTSLRFST